MPATTAPPLGDPSHVQLFEDDAPSVVDSNVNSRDIMQAIASAPVPYRDAVIAVDLLGMSYREAARSLHTREATIATRLYRGRQHVTAKLMAPAWNRKIPGWVHPVAWSGPATKAQDPRLSAGRPSACAVGDVLAEDCASQQICVGALETGARQTQGLPESLSVDPTQVAQARR